MIFLFSALLTYKMSSIVEKRIGKDLTGIIRDYLFFINHTPKRYKREINLEIRSFFRTDFIRSRSYDMSLADCFWNYNEYHIRDDLRAKNGYGRFGHYTFG